MADTDVLDLGEALDVLGVQSTDGALDAGLASLVTAISERLDDMCGAIVLRPVSEQHPGGGSQIYLRQAPASRTAATTITSVTEYASGTATILSAESLTVQSTTAYQFDQELGVLTRRSSWQTTPFAAAAVFVVYEPGRYASTAAVSEKFKSAAKILLEHLWRGTQGVAGSNVFGSTDLGGAAFPGFAIPNAVNEMLQFEMRSPVVA